MKEDKLIGTIFWTVLVLIIIIIIIAEQYWIFLCVWCVGVYFFSTWLYGKIREYYKSIKNIKNEAELAKYIKNKEYNRAIWKINSMIYFGNKKPALYYKLAESYLELDKGNSGLNCLNELKANLTSENKQEELIACERYIEDYEKQVKKKQAEHTAFYNSDWFKNKRIIETIPELNLTLTRRNKKPVFEIYYYETIMFEGNNVQDVLQSWQNISEKLSLNLDSITPEEEKFSAKIKYLCNKQQYEEAKTKTLDMAENIMNIANNGTSEYKISLRQLSKLLKEIEIEIEKEIEKEINIQRAEEIYKNVLSELNKSTPNYDKLLEDLRMANSLNWCKKYWDLKKEIKKRKNIAQSEHLYEQAKTYFKQKKYDNAQTNINNAIKLSPNNAKYKELQKAIEIEYQNYKAENQAPKQYQQGIKYINDGNFLEAIKCLEKALSIKPDDENYKNALLIAKTGKIDITTCTKKALSMLDFINEEQAENIIQARNDGMMWFDYQQFAKQFEIMPHLWAGVEEKIEFPLKQANKYGRRLDV